MSTRRTHQDAAPAIDALAPAGGGLVITYPDVSEDAIAHLKAQFSALSFDTPANYELGRKAIATLRELRGKVEKRRKDLKADSLEFGRKVDAAAKHYTRLIEAIEDPLQAAKDAVDQAEAERKRAEEKAELLRLDEQLRAQREAEEASAKKKREEEEAKLAAERAEIDRQRAQQEAAAEAERERQRQEQARIDEERARLEAERRKIEAAQAEERRRREAAEQAEKDAIAERDRQAAAAAEQARLEAARPDIEKVHAFAAQIAVLAQQAPELGDQQCQKAILWAVGRLSSIAEGLEAFKGKAA